MAPFSIPVVEARCLAPEDLANSASYTRDLIRHNRLLKTLLLDLPRHPLRSGTMGLEEILHATPPGLPVDDFPVFVLEDAIAVYEDGTAVNLLAQHGKRKVYIRGRLVRDDGDEEDAGNGSWFIKHDDPENSGMTKDRSGEYISEEFSGQVAHSTGQITLWVNLQQKWFELKPAPEYLLTYQHMFNVVGIFWTNVRFVEEGGHADFISAPRGSSAHSHLALLYIVAAYQTTDNGCSFAVRELLENVDECGDWLRTECLNYGEVRLDKSSLFMWLQAADRTQGATKNLAKTICGMARNIDFEAEKPAPDDVPATTAANKVHGYYKSTAYPNGYQRFSTIGRLVNILAMHALEHRKPRITPAEMNLNKLAYFLEREFNIRFHAPCVAFLQNKRLEILRDLSVELHNTQLYTDLKEDPGPRFPRFSGVHKAAHRSVYEKLISGKLKIVRRGYIGPREDAMQSDSAALVGAMDGASDGMGSVKYEDMMTGKTVADYPDLASVFSRPASADSSPLPEHEPGIDSEPGPVRVSVPVHKHLEQVTSYGDGSTNPVAEMQYGGSVQDDFLNDPPRVRKGYGDAF